MKIFYSEQRKVIVVTGSKQAYPPQCLSVTSDGNDVTVWLSDDTTKVVSARFDRIADANGQTFSDVQSCIAYLEVEFSKRPETQWTKTDW